MPADKKTRILVARFFKFGILYNAIIVLGMLIGLHLLYPLFFETQDIIWLFILAYIFLYKAVRKSLAAKTRAVPWIFIFNPLFSGILTAAVIALYFLSIGGTSIVVGLFHTSNTMLIAQNTTTFIILLALGYIGVSALLALIIYSTTLRTQILTISFKVLALALAVSLILSVNIIPWLQDLQIYIFYLLFICISAALLSKYARNQLAKSLTERKLEKISLRNYLEITLLRY